MMTRILIALLLPASATPAVTLAMDSTRGKELFSSLSCVGCHSVQGQGGRTAPDLGRPLDRGFTPALLASTMWNHAPTMWAAMRDRNVRAGELDEQGAADLFAYFYTARFFEKPGDAGRGKRAFSAKHCAECHGLIDAKIAAAKPVAQWESMSRPVALVNAMWNHAVGMREEFARRKLSWPSLTSQELTDIFVYVRNLPGTTPPPETLLLNSGERGQALFESKGCIGCHKEKMPLGMRLRTQTLTDIAVDLWNHSPRMVGSAPSMDLQEMRDLISYLWAQQFFADSGDRVAGERVFVRKRCIACHEDASSGAPKLTGRPERLSGAAMVSALWRHGPKMMEQMKAKNIPWPRFDGGEMSNLIAYLNSRNGEK